MPTDFALFMRQLARNPTTISAIAPSSRGLARAITHGIGPQTGRVVEFGPGTGVFTRALLDRGVLPGNLTLFELNPDFAANLRANFHGVHIVTGGAQTIADHCADVGAVVSGLPLLSFPPNLTRTILQSAIRAMRPDGVFHQFTYGPRPPVPDDIRASLNLTVTPGPRVWRNLPPARVYCYQVAG
jgi:phosphatidylethanolamine/phosphatidyl-N-methylethanolamine N-methyltransferase